MNNHVFWIGRWIIKGSKGLQGINTRIEMLGVVQQRGCDQTHCM